MQKLDRSVSSFHTQYMLSTHRSLLPATEGFFLNIQIRHFSVFFFTIVALISVELHIFLYALFAALLYCSADDGNFLFQPKRYFSDYTVNPRHMCCMFC